MPSSRRGDWEHATLLFCAGNCGEQDAQERRMMAMSWIDNYVCDEAAQTNAFDADLNNVGGLTWLPWVGCHYRRGGVLVVGESDYAMNDMATEDETPVEHITRDRLFLRKVIDRFGVKLDGYNPTIANIRRVLARDCEEKGKTLTRFAFMDLCQRAMSFADAEEPSKDDFEAGLSVVGNVIGILRPSRILVLGLGIAKAVGHRFEATQLTARINRCHPFSGNMAGVQCLCIRHPGRYFSSNEWKCYLQNEHPEFLA